MRRASQRRIMHQHASDARSAAAVSCKIAGADPVGISTNMARSAPGHGGHDTWDRSIQLTIVLLMAYPLGQSTVFVARRRCPLCVIGAFCPT